MRNLIARAALAVYAWAARPVYVMVYDHGDPAFPFEEYYGYFTTPGEARERYADLAREGGYWNARLCMMVEPLLPLQERADA